MNRQIFVCVLSAGIGLVCLGGWCSWLDGYFTRAQMLRVHGITKGYSFLQHGGMWCDLFAISLVVAYVASTSHLPYFSGPSGKYFAGAVGFWLFAALYFQSLKLPEAHNHYGHTTAAGWIHLGFAVVATWILALFYLSHPVRSHVFWVSVILTLFFPLGMMKFDRDWHWNPFAAVVAIGGPITVWSIYLYWY